MDFSDFHSNLPPLSSGQCAELLFWSDTHHNLLNAKVVTTQSYAVCFLAGEEESWNRALLAQLQIKALFTTPLQHLYDLHQLFAFIQKIPYHDVFSHGNFSGVWARTHGFYPSFLMTSFLVVVFLYVPHHFFNFFSSYLSSNLRKLRGNDKGTTEGHQMLQ